MLGEEGRRRGRRKIRLEFHGVRLPNTEIWMGEGESRQDEGVLLAGVRERWCAAATATAADEGDCQQKYECSGIMAE